MQTYGFHGLIGWPNSQRVVIGLWYVRFWNGDQFTQNKYILSTEWKFEAMLGFVSQDIFESLARAALLSTLSNGVSGSWLFQRTSRIHRFVVFIDLGLIDTC